MDGLLTKLTNPCLTKESMTLAEWLRASGFTAGCAGKLIIFFFILVPSRNAETLLQMIKDRVEARTTIISDCWKAYNCLTKEGFHHLTVNHSLNFVDPVIAAHTNTIERKWQEPKAKVPYYGTRKYHFVRYLAQAIFLRIIPDANQHLHRFLLAATNLYLLE